MQNSSDLVHFEVNFLFFCIFFLNHKNKIKMQERGNFWAPKSRFWGNIGPPPPPGLRTKISTPVCHFKFFFILNASSHSLQLYFAPVWTFFWCCNKYSCVAKDLEQVLHLCSSLRCSLLWLAKKTTETHTRLHMFLPHCHTKRKKSLYHFVKNI